MRKRLEQRAGAARWLIACVCAFALAQPARADAPTPDELAQLEAALAENPEDEAARSAYGEALLRAGDALASLRVLNPKRLPGADWVRELRASARLYRKRGELLAARKALKDALDLSPNDRVLYAELSEVIAATGGAAEPAQAQAESTAPVAPLTAENAQVDPPADAPAAISPTDETRERERKRAARAEAARELAQRPAASPLSRRHALIGGAALAVTIVAWLLWRVLRGSGDVAVSIELPEGARATLSVRLSRGRGRQRPPPRPDVPLETRASSRFEHNMVARETHFRGIPAGRYWATAEGVVELGANREGVREEQELLVEKGRATRLVFDLRLDECPVEVRIVRGGARVANARVALGGDPTSLRRTRDGIARLSLPLGEHTLLAGAEDRAAERKLKLERIVPVAVEIDLGDPAALTFSACEPAVEPFLRGDLSVAAAALQKTGQEELAALLSGRFFQSRGSVDSAAEHFESAGRWLEAAELRAEAGELTKAAGLFERAGDLSRAGEMYNAAGDL
ncbi:MAG TPA: hypothetical protein VFT98_01265, partial [Myxococcota bacterium]|nr:hypothetical protein [Myxococcota bacterium]